MLPEFTLNSLGLFSYFFDSPSLRRFFRYLMLIYMDATNHIRRFVDVVVPLLFIILFNLKFNQGTIGIME